MERKSLSEFFGDILPIVLETPHLNIKPSSKIYDYTHHALNVVAGQLAMNLGLTSSQVKSMTIKDIEYIASTDFSMVFIDSVLTIPSEQLIVMPYEEIMFLFGMLSGNISMKQDEIKRSQQISLADKSFQLKDLTEKLDKSAIIRIVENKAE